MYDVKLIEHLFQYIRIVALSFGIVAGSVLSEIIFGPLEGNGRFNALK